PYLCQSIRDLGFLLNPKDSAGIKLDSLNLDILRAPRLIVAGGEAACHNPDFAVGTAVKICINRGALNRVGLTGRSLPRIS
ncbi:MAG: hypothetical protein VKJ85_10995, partial [Prochlorothrix sp.]|nr:hypothetical protein [Prochlorothrix sp.]